MTHWMRPPELARARERDHFDPVIEGARDGLSRELSLAIWERVCADATDSAGRLDADQAQRRFHDIAAHIRARGGRLRPDVGRLTRVQIEAIDAPRGAWAIDELAPHAPGKTTLVAAEMGQRMIGGWLPPHPFLPRDIAKPSAPGRRTLVDGLPSLSLGFDDYRVLGLKEVLQRLGPEHPIRAELIAAAAVTDRSIAGRATLWREPLPGATTPNGHALWHAAERHTATLYRRAVHDGIVDEHDPAVESALQQRGAGPPLPMELRRDMERALGISLAGVRIHTDSIAAQATRVLGAEAFTVGEDIFFAEGTFAPDTLEGRKLLAHELAHIAQAVRGRDESSRGGMRVSQPGDASEREADAVAERMTSTSVAAVNGQPSITAVPASVAAQGMQGAAVPLPHGDAIQRAFGPHDLRGVRAFVGGPAAHAAEAMGALAYTTGGAVAFRSAPDLRTAAHEAAHVIQQRGGARAEGAAFERHADEVADAVADGHDAAPLLDRVASPLAAPTTSGAGAAVVQMLSDAYKPLTDRIAAVEDDSQKTYGIGGLAGHLRSLRAMKDVAEAVEAGDVTATKAAVAAFLAAIDKDSFDPATAVVLGDVPLTLVTRVYLLGLLAESRQLKDHFFGKQGKGTYQQPSSESGYAGDFAVWRAIADEALARAGSPTAVGAEAAIDTILVAFKGIEDAIGSLDPKQIQKDIEEARKESMYSEGAAYVSLIPTNPDRTMGGYFQHLFTLFPPLVVGLMTSFQVMMDAAVADLEAGKSDAALEKARAVLEGKLKSAFDFPRLLDLAVDITRSDFVAKKKQHFDFFDKSAKSPAVTIQAFDKDESFFSEKQLTLQRIFQIRFNQIRVLQRIYGFAKDGKGHVTTESAENAAAIEHTGGLKLHDNDGWRAFLLEKYKAAFARTQNEWVALSATIDVLQAYLFAFTIHTPYNIDEFGDNYLTRTFPRALTGQLIQDCGVYALRTAYALSLVRKELGLVFRAVVMPVHVALVISYEDVSKGAFFLNNEQIIPVPPDKLKEFAAEWQSKDETGAIQATPEALDADAFFGEIAAATFVERTDIPYRVEKVPEVPNTKDAAKRHRVLWDFYHDKVIKRPVIVGDKDEAQPELRYLALLEHEKDAYNRLTVPYWQKAFGLFNAKTTHGGGPSHDEIVAAADDVQAGKDAAKVAAGKKVLEAHQKALLDLAKPLLKRADELKEERQQVSDYMAAHPKAVGPGAKLAPWRRLELTFNWHIRLHDYLGDQTPPGKLLEGNVAATPWAREDQLLEPLD